eukprot:SAG31_NODE_2780_length_5098_cov_2.124000_3_plen_90_part_00
MPTQYNNMQSFNIPICNITICNDKPVGEAVQDADAGAGGGDVSVDVVGVVAPALEQVGGDTDHLRDDRCFEILFVRDRYVRETYHYREA